MRLDKNDSFIFFDTNRTGKKDYKSYLFTKPLKVISCYKPSELKPSLDSIEAMVKKGYFAAGFLSYEAGFAFEDVLRKDLEYDFPLLWFGLYKRPRLFNHKIIKFMDSTPHTDYSLKRLKANISERKYVNNIKRIKSYIEEGHTYQVNFTFKLNFLFDGSAISLYLALRRNQRVSYSALIKFKERYIISLSPEMFFRKNNNLIQVRPMKGTAEKGRYLTEDINNGISLSSCPKNRSENIMIVDLLRNDLGRASKTNTVKVKRLFEVENYESVIQMTSAIESRLKDSLSLYSLFEAIFPSGSVTGAPKIKTMQIIDKLENQPRRIYTGSIGFISPKNESVFNVAIRTILIDKKNGAGEMGIGSGIVYDSDPKKEYNECRLKAEFLTKRPIDFKLIETILWEAKKGYFLLEIHLERLLESAAYFGFLYDKKELTSALKKRTEYFNKSKNYKVRLLLDRDGAVSITSEPLRNEENERLVTFSKFNTSSSDIFLFHKTTKRDLYERQYQDCKKKGFYDFIFQNEKGEVTEGTISNIFVKKGNIYYTPPVNSGLLNGVYRRYILKNKIFPVQEKILYRKDIENATEIYLTNAVRKMVKVKLVER